MRFVNGFLKRLLFVFALAAGVGGFVPAAHAQTVSVQGNKSVETRTIQDYFRGSSEAEVNDAVKNLYATGLFSDVEVRREGGRIVVTVAENGRINHVAVEGNSKIKTEEIEKSIQSKSSGPFNPSIVQADVQRILDMYRRAGRSDATVTYRVVQLPISKVDVVFEVKEGVKTGIRSIVFVGNHVYSNYRLRLLMETTEMNFLSWLKSSDVYDPDRIGNDEDTIRKFYLKHGYADFRIIGSDARFDPAKNGYVLTISLYEGPQYRVSSVSVDSHLASVDPKALQRAAPISAGDVYNADLVQKSVDILTHEVSRAGYPFAKITPRGDRDTSGATVALSFDVEEGPHAYVERIDIHGNTRTRDYVIRREFDLGEGDPYNQTLVDEAKRRLVALGFFKSVNITNLPGSSADKVVIDVAVEDKPTGSFGISGGYSTTDGFIAELSVQETNFMGRGQFVRTSVSIGQYGRGVTFSFTQPYFLGYRMAGGFDLYARSADNTRYALYSTVTTGGTLRLGVPITDDLSFSPSYSLYRQSISIPNTSSTPYNDCTSPVVGTTPGTAGATLGPVTSSINCVTNGEASLVIKQLSSLGAKMVSSVGYGFTFSTLDNPQNPTEGFLAQFKQEVAGLGFNTRFVRTTGDIRYYHPVVTDDIVGLLRLQGGDEFAYGGDKLNILDNFNLGPQLVRGFAPGGIGPRDVSPGSDPNANSIGGTKYFGGTAEIDFPIWGAPKELGLRGGVFADFGTLWGYQGLTNFNNYVGAASCLYYGVSPGTAASPATLYANNGNGTYTYYGQSSCINVQDSMKIRSSVGVSLIWSSPIGPIRFDYSFVTSKAPGDVTQVFSFSGGTTF